MSKVNATPYPQYDQEPEAQFSPTRVFAASIRVTAMQELRISSRTTVSKRQTVGFLKVEDGDNVLKMRAQAEKLRELNPDTNLQLKAEINL